MVSSLHHPSGKVFGDTVQPILRYGLRNGLPSNGLRPENHGSVKHAVDAHDGALAVFDQLARGDVAYQAEKRVTDAHLVPFGQWFDGFPVITITQYMR